VSRKRKTNYPPPKSSRRGPPAGSDESYERPNLATINLTAAAGKAGLRVGDRVRINSTGLYANEIGVIERLSAGVIPSALVRTEAGSTRQVRTVDLVPDTAATPEKQAPAAD
jgi:hypothetical protein